MKCFGSVFFLLLLCASIGHAREKPEFGVEITTFYAWNQGVSEYADAVAVRESEWFLNDVTVGLVEDDKDLWVPGLRAYYNIEPQWQLGLGYQRVDDMGAQCYYIPAITIPEFNGHLLRSEEVIDDVYADLRYRYPLTNRLHLEVGVKLSWMRAELERFIIGGLYMDGFYSYGPKAFDRVSESYWRLGGLIGLNYELGESWSLDVEYQYLKPRFHEMHLLGLKAGYRF